MTLKPHVQRSRYRLEAFNEYMILLICTHFMPTSTAGSATVQNIMGQSCNIFFGLLIAGNMGYMIKQSVESVQSNKRNKEN